MENLQLAQFTEYLQPRQRDAHKGNFGHLLVVGGDYGFSGAILLAAEAALRVGAGLVSVATRPEHAAVLNLARPEIMCHGVSSAGELQTVLAKATAWVIGPGLGCSAWGRGLFASLMHDTRPMVVDADGLNLLAEYPEKKSNWILTPHPGEAARLLKQTISQIQQDRVLAVQLLQRRLGGCVVLKGAGSLVASAEKELAICTRGNPGMASGGMGDVLSGVIGGLLAQGVPATEAAKLGVLIHAMAGDLAAKAGERGMIASDLMPYLRQLLNGV